MEPTHRQVNATIPESLAGERLDLVLVELFPDYSRSRLQKWIKDGHVTVNHQKRRAKDPVFGGETVELSIVLVEETQWQAQPLPLHVVYEDDFVIVINKPADLVVHPGAGNMDGTLGNALLHRYPELGAVPRAGVIHRLDKDTSGLLVVARNLVAQKSLVEQLQARAFERQYQALVVGVMTAGGTVNAPIARHPTQRIKMAVVRTGKEAITHYRVMERFRAHSLVKLNLETGRTHQIRVHMAYIRYPLVGDPLYGGRLQIPSGCSADFAQALREFKRQALHAARLGFVHPHSGEFMAWDAPVPADMQALIAAAREDADVNR
ncbi:MAG: 23S rRNA pseudouridine(1911/1915/1917) synthase RluD [Gammaproteobacteria bacterium]|nr:23S rRNA pseudouridine(1911/1915/1917) synthase RluD [Gammaproteobacteria bacterium]